MKLPFFNTQKRVYLDYASITPISQNVVKAMTDSYASFYNPSSIHKDGVHSKVLLDKARQRVADFFHAHPDEIIFTSGGTESCVTALCGVVSKARPHIAHPHIVISAIEHPAVLETAKKLETEGASVSILPVDEYGLVDVASLKDLITDQTVLVSVLMTNNEIGSVEPIRDISLYIQKYRKEQGSQYPLLHTDASQSLLYEEIDLRKIHVDLLTGDGIKCYGPRGIGLLFKRRGVPCDPLLTGGGQEFGMRSGTENVPAILGFAEALTDASQMQSQERDRLLQLRTYLIEQISITIPSAYVHGKEHAVSPHIVNICFPGSDAEYVVLSLDALGVDCAYASACKSLHGDASSDVVRALGKKDCEKSSVRFSFGRDTTKKEIDILVSALRELVHRGVLKK